MAQASTDLRQLKGIGKVLEQRLKVAGLGSYDGILNAGEEGLRKIPGMKPQAIPSILDQARELSHGKKMDKAQRIEAVQGRVNELRERINALAEKTRERFGEELQGAFGKKLTKELTKVADALDQMGSGTLQRPKRAGRGLDKAERRMEGLEEANLSKIRKRLKKSRRALVKALA